LSHCFQVLVLTSRVDLRQLRARNAIAAKAEFAKYRNFIRVTSEKGGGILSGDRNLFVGHDSATS